MEKEISTEELRQIIRAARVLATDFNEEQIQSLSYAWQNLVETGFLDAVWGMVRLNEEKGISCAEALDANEEFLKRKETLEKELNILKDRLNQEHNRYIEDTKIHQQLVSKIKAANNELQVLQAEIKTKTVSLSSIQEKAEKEKRRIEKDLERCKKEASVTTEEIAAAGQLKVEIEKSSFTLRTMIGVAQEFSPYRDAEERLATALKKEQTLTEHISSMEKESEQKKLDITATIDQLISRQKSEQAKVNQLQKTCHQLEVSIEQLQKDVVEEQNLRQFYIRYRPLSDLLEYLVSWKQVYFFRCDNPVCAPFAGVTRFWTDRPVRICPHCGFSRLKPDPEPFRILNMPEGTEFRLRLG